MNSRGLKSIAVLAVALVIGSAPAQAGSDTRDRSSESRQASSTDSVKEIRAEVERLVGDSYTEKVQADIDRAVESWVVAVTNADTRITDQGLDAYLDSELSAMFHEAGLAQSESETALKSLIKTLASAELDRILVKN